MVVEPEVNVTADDSFPSVVVGFTVTTVFALTGTGSGGVKLAVSGFPVPTGPSNALKALPVSVKTPETPAIVKVCPTMSNWLTAISEAPLPALLVSSAVPPAPA